MAKGMNPHWWTVSTETRIEIYTDAHKYQECCDQNHERTRPAEAETID